MDDWINDGTEAKRSHRWIGKETYRKEADFSGLVGGIHIPICKAIHKDKGRPGDPPYLFVDLHGGPGRLRDDAGREFDGSPLIALDALARAGIPHETLHFEKDPAVAAELAAVLDPSIYPNTTVCNVPFREGMEAWLRTARPHEYRFGLAYSDPIEDPIPVDVFNMVAAHSPRVDLLAYVAANNQYKRANANGHGHGRRLADDVAAVRKKKVLIRVPAGGEQYTFILFSNMPDLPKWKNRGFHEVGPTGPGRNILDRLNLSKREWDEQFNTPLWGDGDVA